MYKNCIILRNYLYRNLYCNQQLVDLTRTHRLEIKTSCSDGYRKLIQWLTVRHGWPIQGELADEVKVVLKGLDVSSVREFLATEELKIYIIGVPSLDFDYAHEGIQRPITFPYTTWSEAELASVINVFKYLKY